MKHHPALRKSLFSAMLALSFLLPAFAKAAKPSVPADAFGNSLNQFNFTLYRAMGNDNATGPMFCSPFSVYVALAMTTEGMDGQSLALMQKVMNLPPSPELHARMKAMMAAISAPARPFALAVANAIWPGKDMKLQAEFVRTVKEVYGGNSTGLDYAKDAEKARAEINAWVEKQTNNRIKDLLPFGSITAATSMVLTNAIYFKADWKTKFEKAATSDQPFTQLDGSTSDCRLMVQGHDAGMLNYAEFDGAQVLELPYKGDELSMILMLPETKGFSTWEQGLDLDRWNKLRARLSPEKVDLYLPKFKMETGGSIKPALSAMGMGSLFGNVNLGRMFDGAGSMAISDVYHKAFVEVGEEGTEAAAATAVVVMETSARFEPEDIKTFRADHPFLFAIQHKATGAILFMGRVVNPQV